MNYLFPLLQNEWQGRRHRREKGLSLFFWSNSEGTTLISNSVGTAPKMWATNAVDGNYINAGHTPGGAAGTLAFFVWAYILDGGVGDVGIVGAT